MTDTSTGRRSRRSRVLHSGWTVSAAAGDAPAAVAGATYPATVPGVVHTDLLAAGAIADPYLDDNESALAWIGLTDWTYRLDFHLEPGERAAADRHELVFEGLDTVATIHLNGKPLAEVANQHRSYRFDVGALLVSGRNQLTVAFRSPVRYANAESVRLGARPRPYPMPYEAIRKSACSFGWDWGTATFTSGIWRPVRLESWSTARLGELRVTARPDGDGGVVEVDAAIERADPDAVVELEVTVAGVRHAAVVVDPDSDRATVHVELAEVDRWWPVGYGEQALYDVDVRLGSGGWELDSATRRVGFRDVRWDTVPDQDGTPFQLMVNDQPVFVKGANWIPDDAFPSRVDRGRYERRLRQARDANLNLIRVWGGGIYEDDAFYELCDELGLLTWQDFLFACAAYPEEQPLFSEIAAEARENTLRLAHHASLVLLTGNNENLWGYEDWDWKRRLDGRTWGADYYYELLPAIVAENAPHVPYAPGSPFSPHGQHPNDERHGSMHIWDLWNSKDWPHYRDYVPRFVAEFGWQAPPTWTTLRRAISDDPLTPESPGMIVHQKATEGNTKLAAGLVNHFRVPDEIESWHWAMQLNQALAISCALEHFRSWAPHTSGAVVWQLNDSWPVTSWSAIDGDGRAKPVLHAIAHAFAPRIVTVQPRETGLVAVVGNDTPEPWRTTVSLTRRAFGGEVLAGREEGIVVPARGSVTIDLWGPEAVATDPAGELLLAQADDVRGWWFFAEPRNSRLVEPRLEVSTEPGAAGTAVRVTAGSLAREVTILADRLGPDAAVDDGLVTLLPGESHTFRVTGCLPFTAEDVTGSGALRTANELVHG